MAGLTWIGPGGRVGRWIDSLEAWECAEAAEIPRQSAEILHLVPAALEPIEHVDDVKKVAAALLLQRRADLLARLARGINPVRQLAAFQATGDVPAHVLQVSLVAGVQPTNPRRGEVLGDGRLVPRRGDEPNPR